MKLALFPPSQFQLIYKYVVRLQPVRLRKQALCRSSGGVLCFKREPSLLCTPRDLVVTFAGRIEEPPSSLPGYRCAHVKSKCKFAPRFTKILHRDGLRNSSP